jgi:hypothetical protein
MIGGFALVASPAAYESRASTRSWSVTTASSTSRISRPEASEQFQKMALFNPDELWDVVRDSD